MYDDGGSRGPGAPGARDTGARRARHEDAVSDCTTSHTEAGWARRGDERAHAAEAVIGSLRDAAREVAAWLDDRAAGTAGSSPAVVNCAEVDRALIGMISALEEVKASLSASQAKAAAQFARSQRAQKLAEGLDAARASAGIGAQLALARHQSPHQGNRWLGFSRALDEEMPHTLAALQAGAIDEWRATILVRESATLTREDRAEFDRRVAGRQGDLMGVGAKRLAARARGVAAELDAASLVERARRAESERCVTVRPAPDAMAYLTALLPMAQAVAIQGAMDRAAARAKAAGDPRSRGQVMADELVARLVDPTSRFSALGMGGGVAGGGLPGGGGPGKNSAWAAPPTQWTPPELPALNLELGVLIPIDSLLGLSNAPGAIRGYGPVPAQWVRDLVAGEASPDGDAGGAINSRRRIVLRRLFTAPGSGALVAMESQARLAPAGLAALISARDGTCRTPWCDAPIRHIDHIVPAARGGPTAARNLQGLCEACNHTKELDGWQVSPVRSESGDGEHSSDDPNCDVVVTTPTGHTYVSPARAPAQW